MNREPDSCPCRRGRRAQSAQRCVAPGCTPCRAPGRTALTPTATVAPRVLEPRGNRGDSFADGWPPGLGVWRPPTVCALGSRPRTRRGVCSLLTFGSFCCAGWGHFAHSVMGLCGRGFVSLGQIARISGPQEACYCLHKELRNILAGRPAPPRCPLRHVAAVTRLRAARGSSRFPSPSQAPRRWAPRPLARSTVDGVSLPTAFSELLLLPICDRIFHFLSAVSKRRF